MSLTKIWSTSPEQLEAKHIKQVIAFAGNGRLLDQSPASLEFRNYLSLVPASLLTRYANECLSLKEKFDESGFALQDIINEVGKRLGFQVQNGRYRGIQNQSGDDGLWIGRDGYRLLIEVKTTDAYRIDLNNIASYRQRRIDEKEFSAEHSAILIVVGRNDTGDLEAQTRGSKHAWDIRLISVEALLRLMKIKEDVEDPNIIHKVASVLIPREYTKLDSIIDLVFSTAEDIRDDVSEEAPSNSKKQKFIPVSFHEACVLRAELFLKKKIIKQTRSTYTTADGETHLVCAISRLHDSSGKNLYWYAFHPHQKEFLRKTKGGYVVFGCGSEKKILLIPFKTFFPWLGKMNITTKADGRFYWHVFIFEDGNNLELHLKKGNDYISLNNYLI